MLMKERWFTDVPVVITVLLTHLQQSPTTPYACFWQQMNNIECYIAHFELILGCIRLAPRIVETKLLKIDCCTSARKHTIVSLLITALAALASYAATADESTTEDEELFVSFRTQVLLVMKHGVSVLDSLQCITTDTTELKLIYSRFIQLIPELRTLPLKRLGITLAEFLVRVRHKLSVKDWTTLLRRLYKMMLQTEETNLTTELQAAHIASMMQEQPWPDLSLLRSRIGYFHSASPHVASGQSISQLTLESHSPLKVFLDAPQTHLLHWLEMQHFLRYLKSNEQLQINLMRCSPTIYYETLIARISEKMSTAVSSRLRELKKDLELKKEKTVGLTRLEHLCWAQINTALFHDDLQMNKEMLAVEIKTNEDYLEDLLQSKEFTTVTIANEVKLINQAATALQSFREFYEKADSEPITSDEVFIDWDALVDDLTSLALFMQLAGYTNLATEAWILHYRITNTICDEYGSLRSLQYFFEKNEYFLNSTTHGINLVEEIERKQNFLLNAMQQLPKIVKKYQNHLLMCLCHLACYYAKIGHMSYAQILLKYVSQIHDELPTQLGKYNVVLGTVDVVKFRILWKHLHMGQSKISSKLAQRSLVRHMENTLERFRGDFFKLSTSELLNYSILLMSLIEEVAECAANRLCDQFVNSFFAGILKLLYQSGSALRVIQVLAMWALINLQMEYIPKAQVKLKLIEYMLGLRSLEEVKEMREKPATAKKSTTASSALEFVQSGMEPLRRMISLYASPIKSIKLLLSPSARSEGKFDHFLHMQCNDTLQQYEIFQWCCFMLGCLTARLHYLADNHENLEDFYEASQQWLDERLQTDLHISFQNIQLMRLQHYANFLRSQKKYEKALNCLQVALDSFSKMRGNVDNVYHINFLLQLNATKKEMSVSKQTESRGGLRRALTFNISPDLETPVSTAWNKLTTTAMKIYASDDSTPQRAAEPAKKSAHETNAQISKARKLRRQMAGEFPFKTPAKADIVNVKSSTKSLTARKIKELRAAKGDLFSSSSNNTPESDVDILNQCQRIQSIDLVDSDDANSKQSETPIVTVNTDANQINKRSVRKTGKHNENIMDICHKIESINLVDEPTVISSDSGTSTLQATATKAHTPEIVGITDDADSFKTRTPLLANLQRLQRLQILEVPAKRPIVPHKRSAKAKKVLRTMNRQRRIPLQLAARQRR
ncbi:unnamed protein product [Ceratitis capitata]|uniref:(Mediterranean fruit fly) hypothetical protein n=1 Tax=Ceratitis capitata TaxID=7213 RepID=A0A811VJP7_CERCA|nr:unnamed protein product [Ceratitis capitata]